MNKISVPLGQKNIVIFSKTAFEELWIPLKVIILSGKSLENP